MLVLRGILGWGLLPLFLVTVGLGQESAPVPLPPVGPAAAPTRPPLQEITTRRTDLSGIPAIPFLKIALGDLNGDGRPELVIGGKDGRLSAYVRRADGGWAVQPGWLDGIRAGAFAAPALGDLDGDGRLDLIVGAGGFSAASGRILLFRNIGGADRPGWEKVEGTTMDVGDDAAPACLDLDGDGRPDLVVGNSEGRIRVFHQENPFQFEEIAPPMSLRGAFGKYAAPAAVWTGPEGLLAVGLSTGKIRLFAVRRQGAQPVLTPLLPGLPSGLFPSPAWGDLDGDGRPDLLVADADGNLDAWRSEGHSARRWNRGADLLPEGLRHRPACAPAAGVLDGRATLFMGDMDGHLRWLQLDEASGAWRECSAGSSPPRANGFSRPALLDMPGRTLLFLGEGSGRILAFQEQGGSGGLFWRSLPGSTNGIKLPGHATPCVFDLDGDGRGDLLCGSQDGLLHGFRCKAEHPVAGNWENLEGTWSALRARGGFSVPAMLEAAGRVWLFLGQQDGRVRAFSAERQEGRVGPFTACPELDIAALGEYASPTAFLEAGRIHVVVGDHDGNLREFILPGS